MAQTSTNLKLRIPDGTDPFAVSDFVTNWGKVDSNPGIAKTYTSSSRPANGAWVGQHIYQTDTRQTVVWDGFQWGPPVSTLCWTFWGGVSKWLSSSGGLGTPAVGSVHPYGAHIFRVPTNRPNQALILQGAATFELQDTDSSGGSSNFLGAYFYMNGNQLPAEVSNRSALDLAWDLFPYNRPNGLNAQGLKISCAFHPQIIQIGTGATNAKIGQDNALVLKVMNGFLNGQARCLNYSITLMSVTLGPGSNKQPGSGNVPTTYIP